MMNAILENLIIKEGVITDLSNAEILSILKTKDVTARFYDALEKEILLRLQGNYVSKDESPGA